MRAVVTGAAGFAGYSLVEMLIKKGYSVYAIVRPGSFHNSRLIGLVNSDSIIELDSKSYESLPEYINERCDLFFHLAWSGERDDFETQYNNIRYALNALESASILRCKRFIGIGSQAEYGSTTLLMTEDLKPNPINAYGAAKAASSYLLKCRAAQLGIDFVWGRIFSLYGRYEPKNRLLPLLLSTMMDGTTDTLQLSSCQQNWDYLNVVDAADAIIALGESGHNGEIYNIASGDYKPLREYIEDIQVLLNTSNQIFYGEQANPLISLQPDINKITTHTGWRPRMSFKEGICALISEVEHAE